MEQHFITYEGKEYKVTEPTIEVWNQINNAKETIEEQDFLIYLISMATGLSVDDIKDADWLSVKNTAEALADYFLTQSEKFYNEFEFDGVNYRFIDLDNLTFGEFVDIDEFLRQPEIKRQTNLNMLMALFYREVDNDGKMSRYDASLVKDRALKFKRLPVKYLKGAMRFFFYLENILQASTRSYLINKMYRLRWKTISLLRASGAGIRRSYSYLVKTFSTLTAWLKKVCSRYLTF